ncbi:methyl-CpG-binding domain-containing protein 2-like isoform X2 [Durio zibethinus]|uniref:Methyl-CpG-binding domain-containing protein 2-like isoform X2 n=1 Tax=Durio zibethinus TaxID=66656 RepID=A0A6P5XQJ9_DURZI|nr:methyl-CpG-binding domain-containing protein 2-like isoform X2 [Durio zibethinus]XP_022730475.1 methyl-CpG-binding domain-containing protein 2-like isoform X2 [Durio zibethinus]XP_022730476.1 methyl-CpG-binding domain-containing protein 2-like isoform X2 [Durio zibethinus]XP_022730477.1 methyl-CpG-binding domain-containing protein 2-like isoform X2 [Durio zibethinus]XP_022730478.1 methyl-CpG-binding domain-containing protein 2-like isoform X2 [Durio zibethinus]XP_022730479.1 methyl-CpG-bind
MLKREATDFTGSSFASHLDTAFQEAVDAASSASSSSSSSGDDSQVTQNEDDLNNGNASKQLVLYDPTANGTVDSTPPGPIQCQPAAGPRFSSSRVLPSVGAFTVQCANCFKWRLIPTKEKYEEIREHILENPFVCETAHEWRPDISCDDPTDISQDGSRLWAIDKPNIAQPPPGWQRLLRIRGEGSTKFADIYYQAPSGKRLRSMVEVQKCFFFCRYLIEHPEYATEGVTLSRFSFQIPKPLQEDYVRKRPARQTASHDNASPLEPGQVNPLAWAGPDDRELQHGRLALPPPTVEASVSDSSNRPVKKAKRTPSEQMYRSNPASNQRGCKVEKADRSRNTNYGQ